MEGLLSGIPKLDVFFPNCHCSGVPVQGLSSDRVREGQQAAAVERTVNFEKDSMACNVALSP